MDNLKKILTGMVILLIVILVGGGAYLASMGGMNHGTPTTAHKSEDEQNTSGNPQQNDLQNQAKTGEASMGAAGSDQHSTNTGQPGNQPANPGQQIDNTASGAGTPVIVQIQPPLTDPELYIDRLREKLKAVNEANSSIAVNSGGHTVSTQQNGGTSAATGDMNELHQNFYQLGKDIASMEQNLDELTESIRDSKIAAPQQFSYNYPNPNYQYPGYPYNSYQPGQTNQSNLNNQQSNGSHSQQGDAANNTGHSNSNTQMNHGISAGNLLNSLSIKNVFTLLLLGSVVLGIISVVGFLTSLFKPQQSRSGANNNLTV